MTVAAFTVDRSGQRMAVLQREPHNPGDIFCYDLTGDFPVRPRQITAVNVDWLSDYELWVSYNGQVFNNMTYLLNGQFIVPAGHVFGTTDCQATTLDDLFVVLPRVRVDGKRNVPVEFFSPGEAIAALPVT